jgi:hypothetical protein
MMFGPTSDEGIIAIDPYRRLATYSACDVWTGANTSGGLLFSITGSATTKVRLRRLRLGLAASGANAQRDFSIDKLSSALTGGTSSTLTAVPHDSSFAAATAVAKSWTVDHTGGGALVGSIRADKQAQPITSGSVSYYPLDIDWTDAEMIGAAPVLNSASEVIAVRTNVTLSSPLFAVWVEWSEE